MKSRQEPLIICVGIVWLTGLAMAVVGAQTGDSKTKVKALLEQLEAGPTDAKRLTAEWELLKLGPAILPLLPQMDAAPAIHKERLANIKATLEELQPRTWKVTQTRKMPLAEALALLKKSTGLALVDHRQAGKGGEVTIGAGNWTYWKVADSLAKQTDSRLSLYQPDGQVALIDGPGSEEPTDLSGLFRIAVKRIDSRLDFTSKTRSGILGLEIAWEPRFAPYLIQVGQLSFQGANAGNKVLNRTTIEAGSPLFVPEKIAKEFDIGFAAPPRAVTSLRDFRGQFVVTMPAKTLTFKALKLGAKQTQDGLHVTATAIDVTKDRWSVVLTVEVPEAGPTLDSFQSWLGSNAWLSQSTCQLERGAGESKEVLLPNPLYTKILGIPTATRVMVRYQFMPGATAGDFASWRLTCRVPGRLVEMTVPFSFSSIDLP
jgi:hypothetical protein